MVKRAKNGEMSLKGGCIISSAHYSKFKFGTAGKRKRCKDIILTLGREILGIMRAVSCRFFFLLWKQL